MIEARMLKVERADGDEEELAVFLNDAWTINERHAVLLTSLGVSAVESNTQVLHEVGKKKAEVVDSVFSFGNKGSAYITLSATGDRMRLVVAADDGIPSGAQEAIEAAVRDLHLPEAA